MPSISTLILSRALPIVVMVVVTYIVPHFQRAYLITGMSGKNFAQTDVSQCDVVHRDTLMGCEDLHTYNAPSGPMIFAGCVEKMADQFVAPIPSFVEVDVYRLGFQRLRHGIRVERGIIRHRFTFLSQQRIKLRL